MIFKNWLDTRLKMQTHEPNVYRIILGGVSRGFRTPLVDSGARSLIFWHLKMGTFGKSAHFQVPKINYGDPGEYSKFPHFGASGEFHSTGDSGVSDDSVDSGNSDEFVNLVILVILVILLNLVSIEDFLFW